jgi:oxalate decarboxylase/phosphoglucose isomerase-like protein (cupin superfamily)
MPTPSKLTLMRDPYLEWVAEEGLPVYEDFGVDLFAVEPKPWARLDAKGAAVHLKGRGDFVSMLVIEIDPGACTSPQRHLYEEVVYVLAGRGSTTVEAADGHKHIFEWNRGSMFAIPLNAKYRHFNGSGTDSARMVSTTSLPAVMNMFHNTAFVFDNPWDFNERVGDAKYFHGEGEFIPRRPGVHMWETNFVADLASVQLEARSERGAGASIQGFILADGTMHAHISEMPTGSYKKAHRHAADYHVMCVDGQGYTLLWNTGDADFVRIDWKHGTVFAPPDQMFHQHFNTGTKPARYLATAFGSTRYPFTESKRKSKAGAAYLSVKLGGDQIEYADQSPRIAELYKAATDQLGVEVRMPTDIPGTAAAPAA